MYLKDTERINIMKTIGVISILFLFGVAYIFCDRHIKTMCILRDHKKEIICLKEKIYWLENISNKILVLEQLLTPQMMAELDALNEQIKQTATSGNPKGN